ncbi:MAG: hypothetical protein QOH34_570, partial [Mycobacterium sp.]|nr:hypothetical protein [Mycobacterium sp.]
MPSPERDSAGEIDEAANIAALAQVHERLVDLIKLVVAGDQLIEFQCTCP